MRSFRAFITAFAVTLCVLGLGVGLFTVGYNSKRMAQGEHAPCASYTLQNGQFIVTDANGRTVTLTVQEQAATAPLTPAPVRVSLRLLRGVAVLAEKLAQRLE